MTALRQTPGLVPRCADEARERIRAAVAARAGLEVPAWVLEARVRDRIAVLAASGAGGGPGSSSGGNLASGLESGPLEGGFEGLDPCAAYAQLVASAGGAAELDRLIETVRVGETRFFRHPAHVRALTDVVVPALAQRAGRPVRAWSAGCATGEEAYTLAMILGSLLPRSEVSVLATDMSPSALDTARRGMYPAAALAALPATWREQAFVAEGDGYRVTSEVRQRVSFERHNLMERVYPQGFDVIWCRNVLIYFTVEARQHVVTRLASSLAPDGYLFVGYSESLRHVDVLEPVRAAEAVIYRNSGRSLVRNTERSTGRSSEPRLLPARGNALRSHREDARSAVQATVGAHAAAAGKRDIQQPRDSAEQGDAARELIVRLSGRYEDEARVAAALRPAMAGVHERVVIDLDGATFLADPVAAVLRRAQSAARAAGTSVSLRAERAGMQRWLRRNGLATTTMAADTPGRAPSEPATDANESGDEP